jgi:hypothetical protein
LPAGCVNIFSPASAKSCIDFIFLQVLHENICNRLIRLGEFGIGDWIVLDDIYQICGHLAVNFYQFISILKTVIKILEQNIFKCDFIAGLLVKIIQRINERSNIIGIIDA